jgi:hypothetical protein
MAFTKETQAIIDRLKKRNIDNIVHDKQVIEYAFKEHFEKLGLKVIPFHYVKDLEEGYTYITNAAENAAWSAARSAAWSAAWSAARSAAWSAAWSAARSAAWSAAEIAAWSAARSAAWSAAEIAAESAAWNAAENAAWSAAENAAWSAAESAARSAAWSAAESAARSAAWINSVNKESQTYGYIWLPFVKAYEAGLWVFWITEKEIVICLSPSLKTRDDILHNESGPAVSWENGSKYYFLNGVKMEEKHVLTSPEKLNPKEILSEKNVDVRRELIRKIGIKRMLDVLPYRVLDKRDSYELLDIELSDQVKNSRYLKMVSPSIGVFHLEGVEGSTVQQALNWRAQRLKITGNWEPHVLT